MKKQNRKSKAGKAARGAAAPPAPSKPTSRRALLRSAASWGVVAAALGGGAYWTVGSVRATIAEQDLSRIGNGTPAVVQIHDPNCSMCLALQRETQDALAELEDGDLTYLVANIRTQEGRAFAARHNVEHVTLVLFDAEGRVRDILRGPNESRVLLKAFQRHLGRPGAS